MSTASPPTATMTRTHRTRRFVFRWMRLLGVLYLVIVLVLALLQTKLIFMGASTQGSPDAVVTPPSDAELLKLQTPDGTRIVALFGKARDADGSINKPNNHPTIIWFYGNAMCLKDAVDEFIMFRRLGANVIAVEYAGYGMSGGSPSEQGCYAAAEAAYQYLLARHDIDPHKIVAAGWSLGGAVAIDLAARHAGEKHICGLMTFSTFSSMADVARAHYPFVPASMLLQHRFESEKKIKNVGVPILLGHGRHDNIAPFPMSDRLAAAASGAHLPVTRLTLDDASHNDFFYVGAAGDQLEDAIQKFLRQF